MALLVRPRYAVKYPLTQFSKTLELLQKQTANEYHKIAVVGAEEFLKVMKGQHYNICDSALN